MILLKREENLIFTISENSQRTLLNNFASIKGQTCKTNNHNIY